MQLYKSSSRDDFLSSKGVNYGSVVNANEGPTKLIQDASTG